jgi:ketosteroid isomerase-like protein
MLSVYRMARPDDRIRIARATYETYATGDRAALEALIADDFTFSSPADVGIDRAAYFERCWPNSENIRAFDFKRLEPVGDELVVTYEAERTDGSRFRNTEILGFDGDRIARAEVYFGWNL